MDPKEPPESQRQPAEGEVIDLNEKDRLDEREEELGPPPARRPHRDDDPPKAA